MSIARDISAWLAGTETKKGPIELATQAEVDADTDVSRAVTGATLAATQLPGMLIDVQFFAFSGTWTKPVGAKLVHVECLGGGGGGAGLANTSPNWGLSAAGSGGGFGSGVFLASGWGATVPVTVGGGGAGGASGNNNGANGDLSSFNGIPPYVIGGGGGGGSFAPSNGIGAIAVGGTALVSGETPGSEFRAFGGPPGQGHRSPFTATNMCGGSGAGPFGAPAHPGEGTLLVTSFSMAGKAGQSFGQGGTGAFIYSGTASAAGGAGSLGCVMVRTYG